MNSYDNADTSAGLSVGGILGRTFDLLKKNPGIFIGLTLLAVIPSALLQVIFALSGSVALSGLGSLIGALFSLIIQGAICYAVFRRLHGDQVSVGAAIGQAFGKGGSLLLVAILMFIGLVIGFMLLVIPGIILMLMWAVAIPVCVVERLGPVESLSRSGALTKGYKLRIFLIGLALFVLYLLLLLVVGAILGALLYTAGTAGIVITALVVPLVMLPISAFINMLPAIIYYDLRVLKEGISIDTLVGVFD